MEWRKALERAAGEPSTEVNVFLGLYGKEKGLL
jgi:hypothetical protein